MKQLILASLLLALMPSARALTVAGASLPEQATVAGEPLVLNGAGVRSKFFVKVCAAALCQPQKTRDTETAISAAPKRMLMHVVHANVERDKIVEAWNEGFAANRTSDELTAPGPRIDRFNSMFGDMQEGEQILLDYAPGKGTMVSVAGKRRGTIEGDDFQRALIRFRPGVNAGSTDLETALLGG